jgi:thymidylate kinase
MLEKPLIVFEGVDHSGKTTVSQLLAKRYPEFVWSHEPNFSSEEADRLNSDEFKGKPARREVFFLESRLQQQSLYRNNAVFLDRYLWSGLAYAKAFSPSIYEFCRELYQDYNIFKKPTLTFFMDTPVQTCFERKEPTSTETVEKLGMLLRAYRDTEEYVNTAIVRIDGTDTVEGCLAQCEKALHQYIPNYFV